MDMNDKEEGSKSCLKLIKCDDDTNSFQTIVKSESATVIVERSTSEEVLRLNSLVADRIQKILEIKSMISEYQEENKFLRAKINEIAERKAENVLENINITNIYQNEDSYFYDSITKNEAKLFDLLDLSIDSRSPHSLVYSLLLRSHIVMNV